MNMREDLKFRGNGEGNIKVNLNNTGSNNLIIKEDPKEGRQGTRSRRARSVKELRSIISVG